MNAGPGPILSTRDQAFANRVQVHVIELLTALFHVSNGAIKVAWLPEFTTGAAQPVDALHRRHFEGIHEAWQRVFPRRVQQRMPVIWHEHVSGKKKSSARPDPGDSAG